MDYRKDNGAKPVEVEWDPSIHLKLKDTNARGDVVFNIGGKNSKAKVIELFRYHYYDTCASSSPVVVTIFLVSPFTDFINFLNLIKFLNFPKFHKLNRDGINTFLK